MAQNPLNLMFTISLLFQTLYQNLHCKFFLVEIKKFEEVNI